MKRTLKFLAAGVTAAAVVAAPMAASAQDEEPSIAEIAVENGFDTLVTAVTAAGLADALADCSADDLTVFAPTDAAFGALPEELLQAALADTDLLTSVLLYHVVPGRVLAETVVGLSSATTAQGEDISIAVEGESVVLNGSVTVTATDIEACNGVVHVIDAVLLPPSIAGDDAPAEEAPAEETPVDSELPATGVNSLTAGLAAAALLAGGVALVGVSRRRVTA